MSTKPLNVNPDRRQAPKEPDIQLLRIQPPQQRHHHGDTERHRSDQPHHREGPPPGPWLQRFRAPQAPDSARSLRPARLPRTPKPCLIPKSPLCRGARTAPPATDMSLCPPLQELVELLVAPGDIESLREQAEDGNQYAARRLAELMAERR